MRTLLAIIAGLIAVLALLDGRERERAVTAMSVTATAR